MSLRSREAGGFLSYFATVGACAILVGAGLVHGRITDRWGVPSSVSAAADRLDHLPDVIHGWTSTRRDVSDRVLTAAAAANIVDRNFLSPEGDHIQVMIVCGRPGPVTRHPPNVCFTASGLRQASGITTDRFPNEPDRQSMEFAQCLFESEEASSRFITQWSFSSNGRDWQMPGNPRMAFAGEGWLYKLYIIASEAKDDRVIARRNEFVNQLLAELREVLGRDAVVGETD